MYVSIPLIEDIIKKVCYYGFMSEIKTYKVVTKEGTDEIVEKKSRFIGASYIVESVEDAEKKIAEVSKKYWDARHNCYAYVIGKNSENTRCSDNGEPSGTAGKPILEVITGAGLTNTLVIVTRYFGGVLLGTGGLVRAYTQAAQAAVAASETGEMVFARQLTIEVAYNMINNVKYFLEQNKISISDPRYTENVQYDICVKEEDKEKITEGLIQKCEGKITITEGDAGYYLM